MTPEELRRILSNTEEINADLVANFFQPLLSLQQTTGTKYRIEAPPEEYREARTFACLLMECCDEDDMRSLVECNREGAYQLCYVLSVAVTERLLPHLAQNTRIQPMPGKPFGPLSSNALAWLDEVEKTAPGRTKPPPSEGYR